MSGHPVHLIGYNVELSLLRSACGRIVKENQNYLFDDDWIKIKDEFQCKTCKKAYSKIRCIKLTKGYVTYVDVDDYKYLSKCKWQAKVGGRGGPPYAARTIRNGKKFRTIRMSRVIMGCLPVFEVDHFNSNTLDNRKQNLEIITKEDNIARMRHYKDDKEVVEKEDGVPF